MKYYGRTTSTRAKKQLWNIANTLRGNMDADDLLSEGITFSEIDEKSEQGKAMLAAIREEALDTLVMPIS